SAADQRAYTLVGKHLQQQRVVDAPVDDVTGIHPVLDGIEGRADLRQHAARDRAIGEELVDLARGQPGQQVAVLVEDAGGVGEDDELLRLQYLGDLAGDEVGVDVVGLPFLAHPERRDHRDEIVGVQVVDDFGVYAVHLAHLADVDQLVGIAGT